MIADRASELCFILECIVHQHSDGMCCGLRDWMCAQHVCFSALRSSSWSIWRRMKKAPKNEHLAARITKEFCVFLKYQAENWKCKTVAIKDFNLIKLQKFKYLFSYICYNHHIHFMLSIIMHHFIFKSFYVTVVSKRPDTHIYFQQMFWKYIHNYSTVSSEL